MFLYYICCCFHWFGIYSVVVLCVWTVSCLCLVLKTVNAFKTVNWKDEIATEYVPCQCCAFCSTGKVLFCLDIDEEKYCWMCWHCIYMIVCDISWSNYETYIYLLSIFVSRWDAELLNTLLYFSSHRRCRNKVI